MVCGEIVVQSNTCADPENFATGGPILTKFVSLFLFFVFYEGRGDSKAIIEC